MFAVFIEVFWTHASAVRYSEGAASLIEALYRNVVMSSPGLRSRGTRTSARASARTGARVLVNGFLGAVSICGIAGPNSQVPSSPRSC